MTLKRLDTTMGIAGSCINICFLIQKFNISKKLLRVNYICKKNITFAPL
jgi:hypothetical protein